MIPGWSTLAVFAFAAWVLLVVPGPSVLYIVARSVDQGRAAGIVSALGVQVGSLVHVAAAALGLSAILMSSAEVFTVVKYLGAGYLVYLGVRKLMERQNFAAPGTMPRERLSRIFMQGVVVNVLNPKTALFFLAFLPQFIDPSRGAVAGQIFVLGMVFVTLGVLSDGMYAILAGSARHWIVGNRRMAQIQKYGTAGVFIGLGALTAFAKNR
jgi:threonine/homoserine/homoserine lactone efflux protein